MPPPSAAALEIFKFSVYLSVPIFLTAAVANNEGVLSWVINNRQYVTYPPEETRKLPSVDDMKARVASIKASKSNA